MEDHLERDLLIALSLLPFMTPNRIRLLFEAFDSASSVRTASPALLAALLSVTPEQAADVRNPLTKSGRAQVVALRDHVIARTDAEYPPLLREIPDPPLVLHCSGDRSLLARAGVAIVGSRRATPYAINVAAHLTRPLAEAGLVIVSGLARGVDAAAHTAALDAGGATIAVLGTGIDVIYPRSNVRLFERIAERGLIVSEFSPGTPPLAANFPMRNRLISGLTSGTVVIEATSRSGSLITARMAAEQGREVFAVPGSIFSPASEGTHRLIQYGAKLVHDVNDIVEELPGEIRLQVSAPGKLPDSPLAEILVLLQRDEGAHVDAIAARAGRSRGEIAQSLLQLELDGWIRALPGASYVRIR